MEEQLTEWWKVSNAEGESCTVKFSKESVAIAIKNKLNLFDPKKAPYCVIKFCSRQRSLAV